jgi:hypothetical protein
MRKTRSAIKLPAPLPGLSIRMESAPTLQTIAATVDSLNRTFAEFRANNDERLAELAKGRDDVVTRATTDNLNNAISKQLMQQHIGLKGRAWFASGRRYTLQASYTF